ncbi:DUF2635 domain-containing protein [uncultured Vibrio sp.]|uniref:DUF2635 domain-containing protein n=1 Tax=uncultured Vibrio sp. TaxID=114054 RepID=UPI00262CF1A1|nr:DUF2635 domain-containing protein [uncultured Vibrio sp.]
MKTFKIKPKKGLTVKDPVTREPLKAAGEVKPRNLYWLRRLNDGSVFELPVKSASGGGA